MTDEFVASIFGMPPRNVTQVPQDERQAIKIIMDGLGFPSIYKPAKPELIQQPATVDEMHDIGNGIMYGQVVDAEIDDNTLEQAPSARNLVNTIAVEYGVEPATAIFWLAGRAEEFKTLAESQK